MYARFNKFGQNKINNNKYNYSSKINERSLEKDEEYKLITSWQKNKDRKSLDRLLGAYKKLVVSYSKKFFSYGLPQEDLIQEGMMGLMYSIEKFDISRGFRLSTYAHWWIKAMMQDYILKNWSVVKNGTTASQRILFFSFNKIKNLINLNSLNSLGREEVNKISKILNIKPLDVENLHSKLTLGDKSLNQTITENNDSVELISLLKDNNETQDIKFQETSDNKLKQKWISEAINSLTNREKFIINSRKFTEKPKTLDQVGKELKISKERVRQIEFNSLQKLKKNILLISKEDKEFFIN
tara:strand:- start:148 stop:1041 length:894 start_codon:yes stop_codon:yes gene_type:complete